MMKAENKTCPDCAEEVKATARICRFCRYEFPIVEKSAIGAPNVSAHSIRSHISDPEHSDDQKKPPKWMYYFGLAVVLLVIFSSQFSDPGTADDAVLEESAVLNSDVADANDAIGESESSAPATQWDYSVATDEARGKDVKTASIVSQNSVYLDFPYGGGTDATLYLRQHPSYGLDVFIRASPGQLLCNSYDGCAGLINVDGKAETLSLVGSADNDSEIVFAKFGPAIKDKLMKSKKVIIELPFYSNGNRQFTFNTAGLEWPIPSDKPE